MCPAAPCNCAVPSPVVPPTSLTVTVEGSVEAVVPELVVASVSVSNRTVNCVSGVDSVVRVEGVVAELGSVVAELGSVVAELGSVVAELGSLVSKLG